jgi:7-cyano-7-deazaguanine synthase
MKRAVILLSGGLDSATVAAIARRDFELYALSFAYGQRHGIELEFAAKLARFFGGEEHKIINIDLRVFGHSALTDNKIAVPKDHEELAEIPITYVPARNTIFLSYALAFAEVIEATDIFIGANAVDYSGYPDCRPEYINAFEKMANLATAAGAVYKIHTPLINLTKAEIIKIGLELGVDYSIAHSCYDPIVKDQKTYACGHCDSCKFRLKGFTENNLKDPYSYHF